MCGSAEGEFLLACGVFNGLLVSSGIGGCCLGKTCSGGKVPKEGKESNIS